MGGAGDRGEQAAEFDTVAGWTGAATAAMPRDQAVVAACRGSANPAALAWLSRSLRLGPGRRLVDLGGGIGGPAAWAVDRHGVEAVVLDPMPAAVGSARRRLGLPALVASASALPLADASAGAAWALGVLSTASDQVGLLAEANRVLSPGGRLGVLEYVRTAEVTAPAPAANRFLSADELIELLEAAALRPIDRLDGPPAAPRDWAAVADRVATSIASRHGASQELERADEAERRFAELLRAGALQQVLVVAERPPPPRRRAGRPYRRRDGRRIG